MTATESATLANWIEGVPFEYVLGESCLRLTPGMRLRLADGRELLVGDVNPKGGATCDCGPILRIVAFVEWER